jgi:mono/diheme cytochrome c family protein
MSEGSRSAAGRRPWWRRPALRTVAIVVALLALIASVRWIADRPAGAAAQNVAPQVLAQGERLYASTCAECHGAAGQGFALAGMPAPPLDGSAHSWHHSDEQIVGWLRSGGVQMPAVAVGWSDADVTAVLAFVKSRWEPWQREAQPGTIGE